MSKFDTDLTDIDILIPVTIDPYMLIDHMVENMSYEEILEFFVQMDTILADWDFTNMVFAHFAEQRRVFEREVLDNL